MNNNVNLIAFGTFGNPNGFTQTFFSGNSNLKKSVKAFDVRGTILIYPNSQLYSIRKEFKDGYNMIAYSIYTFAQEPTSARSGSFIGSSILFMDKIAEENITINCLNEFHNNLKNKNVQNDTITVNHSDNFLVSKPKDFDKINFHLREIDNRIFVQTTNKELMVYCRTSDNVLQSFFKKSVDLLNAYDTIYFTNSKEVAEFVRQKDKFMTVDENNFETEIQNLAEETKRKIQASLDEFSKEKEKLENAQKKTYEDFKHQIEKNKEQHRQNEQKIKESEKDLNKINDFYNSFLRKIDELSNQLKSGSKKLDDVKQIYNDNKKVFRESIGGLKIPDFTNSVSQPKATTDIRENFQTKSSRDNYRIGKEEFKIDIFKVATLVLLLLWIGTLVYFLFFNKPERETVTNNQFSTEQIETEKTKTTKLNK